MATSRQATVATHAQEHVALGLCTYVVIRLGPTCRPSDSANNSAMSFHYVAFWASNSPTGTAYLGTNGNSESWNKANFMTIDLDTAADFDPP